LGRATLGLEASNLDVLIDEGLALLAARACGPDDVLRLCRHQRQRGCAALLMSLDTPVFRQRLAKAGLAYLHLFENLASLPDPDPYYLTRSAGIPYFDALASGDAPLAAAIALKSTPTLTVDMEDPADFAYFVALAELAGPAPDPARIAPALAQLAAALSGAPSTRLPLLTAIHQRDDEAFEAALPAFLAEWKAHVTEVCSKGTADPYFANLESHICIEGLALVQVARTFGLATKPAYPFLPEAALDISAPYARPELWEDLA
jgi:hypothetical protein